MAKVSSTSNSESENARAAATNIPGQWRRRLLHLVAFLLLCVGVDRLVYIAAFPQFDKVMRLTTLEKTHDILIVGSSHVFWDLDHQWVAKQTGLKVGMASIPGANMDLRRHLIRDYLKHQANADRPLVIVMEADKHSFDSKRYPETSINVLLGYYHHGILREFLWQRLDLQDRILNTLLHVSSLNPQFVFIGARIHDRAGEILSNLFGPLIRLFDNQESDQAAPRLPEWMQAGGGPGDEQATQDHSQSQSEQADRRLETWRSQYAEFKVQVDSVPLDAFRDLIAVVESDPRVILVLLDTPNFLLFPAREARFDREVRAILKEPTKNDRIKFWRFDRTRFELDSKMFADASHLNVPGRIAYTTEFTDRIRRLIETQSQR